MATNTILIIDDEPANRNTIVRLFDEYDFDFLHAENGFDGLNQLQEHTPDLILLDISMPIKDGFSFLEDFSDNHRKRKVPVCVMTGMADANIRKKCIYLGADDFIAKPFDPVELETRITSLLRISNYQRDLVAVNANLEKTVKQRTQKLQEALEELSESKKQNTRAYRQMINRICGLTTLNHEAQHKISSTVGICAASIAWMCGLPADISENLPLAGQLHDIGMLSLPEKLRTTTTDRMSAEEKMLYYNHTNIGARLFADSNIPLLELAYNICSYHHEHFDGSGCPNGLKGEQIPLEARIFSVAYAIVESLHQHTTTQERLHYNRNLLRHGAGKQFDPDIIAQLLKTDDALLDIITQCE